LNRLPLKMIQATYPHLALFGSTLSYEHLRIFGCACYPNTATTAPHKLTPWSTRCVFLGYSSGHKGYRCLDLSTNYLIISHHVVFDEDSFPLAASPNLTDLDFFWSLVPQFPPSEPNSPCRFYHHSGLPDRPSGSPRLRATCGSSARTGSPSRICAPCGLDDAYCTSHRSGVPSCARCGHTNTCCATRGSGVSCCAMHGCSTSCGHEWFTTS
jgi:hypothetical protein